MPVTIIKQISIFVNPQISPPRTVVGGSETCALTGGRGVSGGRGRGRWCVSWDEHPSQETAPIVSVSNGPLCLSGGLALAQVLFFYVKYLVLFGVPALLMRLDGLTPPPLPRCVSTMFSFTGMWRSVPLFAKVPWGCLVGGAGAWPASKPPSCLCPSLKSPLALRVFNLTG